MTSKKTIIFDFDGTIADTLPFTYEILKELAKKYKIVDLTPEEFNRYRSKSPIEAIKDYKIPLYKLPFLLREGQQMLEKNISKIGFIAGMKETLKELKNRGYRLGVLSSNSKENIERFLKNHNLRIFDFIHSESNIFGKDKSLKNILKSNNLNKNEVIYVGDEVRDIVACEKVGVDVIAVTWGFNSPQILRKYHPRYLINTPSEILEKIST